MDGIEVTKRLREMKYEHPIVALTANAVSGQADIFLGNGFTDFISKPIDIRHMNVILNKLIRDKQPPEVIEAARRQIEQKKEQSSESKTDQSIDSRFQKMFVRDANKSLDALNAVFDKYKSDNFINEEDLQTYIIHTHGVKSVLTHIGNADLSAAAQKLEQSGLDKNFDILTSETPVFLQALKDYIDAVALEIKNNENNIIKEDEDTSFLHEKLLLIKTACEEYDETKAEKAITELREKTWSDSTDETLNNIDKNLLHCDFDEIIDIINKFLEIR
jgi:CheY-like chemotaxis protein